MSARCLAGMCTHFNKTKLFKMLEIVWKYLGCILQPLTNANLIEQRLTEKLRQSLVVISFAPSGDDHGRSHETNADIQKFVTRRRDRLMTEFRDHHGHRDRTVHNLSERNCGIDQELQAQLTGRQKWLEQLPPFPHRTKWLDCSDPIGAETRTAGGNGPANRYQRDRKCARDLDQEASQT